MSMECFTLNWGLYVYFWLVSEFAGVRYGRCVAPLGCIVTFCTLAHLITSSFLEFWDLLCQAVYFNNSSKDHLIIFISIIYHLLQGYYRDSNDKQTVSLGACKRCQCSGHESDCFQVSEIKSSSLEINLSIWLFVIQKIMTYL